MKPAKPATKLRRLTATFESPELEAEFLHDNFLHSTKRFTRFAMSIAAIAFLSYGIHDLLVIPTVAREAMTIRYGIAVPAFAIVLALSFSRFAERFHQPTMLFFGIAVNLVVLWIGAISPPAGFFIYTSFAILFTTLGAFTARLNVMHQLTYTVLTVVLYLAFDHAVTHSAFEVALSMSLTILSMGSIGALAAWQLEGQARQAFLQRRTIKEQMELLDIERQKSEALLLNILPPKIADRLKAENRAIADGFTGVTVLFSDIVGFTQMSARLSPTELVQRLNAVFSRFDEIAEELKLEKIKTIGDAYMVAGGIPTARADHAKAVCEMALRMRTAVEELSKASGYALGVRIGINTGPVVAGVIGKNKFIYDVWGDTVNTASRMESHSVPGAIQITEETYREVKDDFVFESRGEIEVKGKGRMSTYFLVDRKDRGDAQGAAASS